MKSGTDAFKLTGTPAKHGDALQLVADRLRYAILFRAVGAHCTLLLEENYASKGFRIDSKSCDWGPMRGFVCVDPRLSKEGLDKEGENREYTTDALKGHVRHDAIGGLDVRKGTDGKAKYDAPQVVDEMSRWASSSKPIVISKARVNELVKGNHISIQRMDGTHLIGMSTNSKGDVTVPWRLIPGAVCKKSPAFLAACPNTPEDAYGVFVNATGPGRRPFTLQYTPGSTPLRVSGCEAIQGLTNPGSEHLGYRACVTGDYDLFGIWAPAEQVRNNTYNRPAADDFVRSRAALGKRTIVTAVPQAGWDNRYVDQFRSMEKPHHHQHFQLGNITRRLNLVKTQLNTTLQSVGGYTGGALVHHSDEVGNPSPGLRKPLEKCMPILAFLPNMPLAFGIENESDFHMLVQAGITAGLEPDLRPEWQHFLRP